MIGVWSGWAYWEARACNIIINIFFRNLLLSGCVFNRKMHRRVDERRHQIESINLKCIFALISRFSVCVGKTKGPHREDGNARAELIRRRKGFSSIRRLIAIFFCCFLQECCSHATDHWWYRWKKWDRSYVRRGMCALFYGRKSTHFSCCLAMTMNTWRLPRKWTWINRDQMPTVLYACKRSLKIIRFRSHWLEHNYSNLDPRGSMYPIGQSKNFRSCWRRWSLTSTSIGLEY